MANLLRLGLLPPGNDLRLGYEESIAREVTLDARTGAPRLTGRLLRGVQYALAGRTAPPTVDASVSAGQQVKLAGIIRTAAPRVEGAITFREQVAVTGLARTATRASMQLVYDPNLLSDVVGVAGDRFRQGSGFQCGALSRHAPARMEPLGRRLGWRAGALSHGPGIPAWRTAERSSGAGQAAWREGEPERQWTIERWPDSPLGLGDGSDHWRDGLRVGAPTRDVFMRGLPLPTLGARDHWLDADPKRPAAFDRFRDSLWLPESCDENSWKDGALVGYVRRPIVPWVPPVRPPVRYGNNLHMCRMDGGNRLRIGYPCPRQIPRRRNYHVQHQIEITRLSDATPIPTQTITIGLDADSWAWTWSATLLGAEALPLVLPSLAGEPVTLVATIDGHTWHLVVENWQEDRAFGSRAIKVSGRGLSAWLGAPYQPSTSGTLANARTLHQAMEELLPPGEGWTIDWADDTPDWILPSGAWNWTNQAPIQTIHAAAQKVGLVVVPGMADRTLTVQPRYPFLPWHFADVEDPDLFHIPDSAILSLSRRQAIPSQANAVYVHGGEAGGIIARAWRSGSAGDRLAATVSDERITHVDGARLLGSRILAGQETQPEVRSITLPLGGVFLLARIGELLSLEVGSDDVRGVVNGVAITASGSTVRQTITIGEDTPNVWAMWRRILPEPPVLLGTVIAIHADTTRTVELVGGGRLRVRGEGAVGASVWVRAGRIEGDAPDLPSRDIEVF